MRQRDILKRLKLFTCPHCGQLVGCDENGRLGMYSLKMRNRHVDRCEKLHQAANEKTFPLPPSSR